MVQAPQTDPRGAIEIAIPYGTIEVSETVNTSVGTNLSVSTPTSTQKASLVLQGVEMTTTVLVRNGLEAPVYLSSGAPGSGIIPRCYHITQCGIAK